MIVEYVSLFGSVALLWYLVDPDSGLSAVVELLSLRLDADVSVSEQRSNMLSVLAVGVAAELVVDFCGTLSETQLGLDNEHRKYWLRKTAGGVWLNANMTVVCAALLLASIVRPL